MLANYQTGFSCKFRNGWYARSDSTGIEFMNAHSYLLKRDHWAWQTKVQSSTLCIVAHRGVYRAKSCTSVLLAGMFLFCSFRHFCCRMYRLATKRTGKKRVEENANVSLLRHRQPRLHWFVACYVLLLTEIVRGLWSVTRKWIEFGSVHKLYPEESDCIPAVSRPKLVTETRLIASTNGYHSNSWTSC